MFEVGSRGSERARGRRRVPCRVSLAGASSDEDGDRGSLCRFARERQGRRRNDAVVWVGVSDEGASNGGIGQASRSKLAFEERRLISLIWGRSMRN